MAKQHVGNNQFPQLPTPKENESFFHYLNGFCKRDHDPNLVRIYPDLLAPRYYFLVKEGDVKDVIVWSTPEMSANGITPNDVVPYCSVGFVFATTVQIVKIWNVQVGSKTTKSFIGLTPALVRSRESASQLGLRPLERGGNGGPTNGGGNGRSHEGDPASEPGHVTSAF